MKRRIKVFEQMLFFVKKKLSVIMVKQGWIYIAYHFKDYYAVSQWQSSMQTNHWLICSQNKTNV